MRFYKDFSLLILLSILIMSISSSSAQDIIFEETDCPFRKPANVIMDCGYLLVPENYNNPDGKQIRLAVAIARHPSSNPELDPIIYLEGGPGGSPLELLYLTFDYQFEDLFAANRDIIIFDQRGVGLSEPALDCPDMQALIVELLDFELDGETLSEEEAGYLMNDALIACGENLSVENDLSAYNSASNARDIESLRIALGYENVNLWGISYGTRLALTMMRDYPEGIRSVVIDSVAPPDINLFVALPQNIDHAFNILFDSCEHDNLCNENYPNLRHVFFETVEQLNESPVTFDSINPFTLQPYQNVILNGDSFMALIFTLLYDSGSIPKLPQLIYQVADGDFTLISLLQGHLIAQEPRLSYGMHFAIHCQEEIGFIASNELNEAWAKHPDYMALGENQEDLLAICAAFSNTGIEIDKQATMSDIPTLATGGEYDPVTPAIWSGHATETLSNSLYIEFPHSGHGATATIDCPKNLTVEFFLNPIPDALDTSCVDEMEMTYSGTVEIEVEFYSVSLSDYSIPAETVIPVGWEEQNVMGNAPLGVSNLPFLNIGMFARLENSLDLTSITFLRIPFIRDAEMAARNLQSNLNVNQEDVIDYQINDIEWKVFPIEIWGFQGHLAITADSSGSILVMVLGEENLYEKVLKPVLDGFKFN